MRQFGQSLSSFGIDMITLRGDNPDVLYAHELFHIYHTNAIGVNEHVFTKEGKLTLPLWLEGLATYVSGRFNPGAPDSVLLMATDLPKLSRADLTWLAKAFLKEADEKAVDPKNPSIYTKWFGIGGPKLRPDLPDRCGYLLGLKVVRLLAKSNSLEAMVHWRVPEIHQHVLTALSALQLDGGSK